MVRRTQIQAHSRGDASAEVPDELTVDERAELERCGRRTRRCAQTPGDPDSGSAGRSVLAVVLIVFGCNRCGTAPQTWAIGRTRASAAAELRNPDASRHFGGDDLSDSLAGTSSGMTGSVRPGRRVRSGLSGALSVLVERPGHRNYILVVRGSGVRAGQAATVVICGGVAPLVARNSLRCIHVMRCRQTLVLRIRW